MITRPRPEAGHMNNWATKPSSRPPCENWSESPSPRTSTPSSPAPVRRSVRGRELDPGESIWRVIAGESGPTGSPFHARDIAIPQRASSGAVVHNLGRRHLGVHVEAAGNRVSTRSCPRRTYRSSLPGGGFSKVLCFIPAGLSTSRCISAGNVSPVTSVLMSCAMVIPPPE